MLTCLTVRCDWPGCKATLTAASPVAITEARWKVERDGFYSMHLCPAHRRHDWFAVRDAQFQANVETAHKTPG